MLERLKAFATDRTGGRGYDPTASMLEQNLQSSALSSRIQAVTVYRSGAMVERVAALGGGPSEDPRSVKIIGLPLCMSDRSVRVQVHGSGRLPVARDVRVVLELGVPDEGMAPGENEALQAKRLQVHIVEDRLSQLNARRKLIAAIEVRARPEGEEGQPPPPIPTTARLAMVGFQAEQLDSLDHAIAEVRKELVALREELAELEARDREATAARQPKQHEMRKSVVVTLDTGKHDDAELSLTYMVPGARWAPAYTINLSPDMRRGELSMRAAVVQRTGEDWKGVALTLTTADAHRWTELPEMQSLRLGRAQPPVHTRGWRAPPQGADELYREYDRFVAGLPKPAKAKPKPTARPAPARRPPPPPMAPPPPSAPRPDVEEEASRSYALPSSMTTTGSMTQTGMISFGGAPPGMPPPAQAMPARAPQAPSRAKKSRQRRAGASEVIAGALANQAVAMDEALDGAMGPGGGGVPHGQAPEPDHGIRDDMLAYGDLRMRRPEEPRRGNLVLLQRRERYREWLVMREVDISFNFIAIIDRATRDAQAVHSVSLPPRHSIPDESDGFSHAYRSDTDVEIESDGQYHSVALTKTGVDTRLQHVVVPRESTDVFRNIELKNPAAVTLFAGPVDVSVGGNYLLTSTLKTCVSGGKVELGLGVEQAIKVSRNTRFSEETAGLMGGTLKLHHTIEIELANRLGHAVDVEVRERVPTVREGDEEVHVELQAIEPPWRSYEPEEYKLQGGHRWEVALEPGQKRNLRASYAVRLSSRRELVGGNRRE